MKKEDNALALDKRILFLDYSHFNPDTLFIIIQFLGIQHDIPQLLSLSHTCKHFHNIIHEEMAETLWEPLFNHLLHPHNNIFIFENRTMYQHLKRKMLYGIDRELISKMTQLQCKTYPAVQEVSCIQQDESIKLKMLQDCKHHFWTRRFPILLSIALVLLLLMLFCILLGGKFIFESFDLGFQIPTTVVVSPIYILCFGVHLIITVALLHHVVKNHFQWKHMLHMQHMTFVIIGLLLYAMFILFPLFTVLGIHIQILFSYSLFLIPMILFVMCWIVISSSLWIASCCITKRNHPWNWYQLHSNCCSIKQEEWEEEEQSKQRFRFILLNLCIASPILPSIFVLLLLWYCYSQTIPLLVVFSPLLCLDALVSLFFLFMACPHMCIYVWNMIVKQQWKSIKEENQHNNGPIKENPSASLFVLFGLGMFIICCLNMVWKIAFSFVVWFIPQTDSHFGIYTCITICIPLLCCLVLPLLFIGLVIRCEMKHQYTVYAQLQSLFVPNKYVLWL